MTYDLTHFSIDDFLRARSEGDVTFETSAKNLENFFKIWIKKATPNVLVDLRGRAFKMSEREIREISESFAKFGLGYLNKVAFVYDVHPKFDEAKFLEFLARAKGMRLRSFGLYEDAIEWLGTSSSVTA